jgi:hypothetical protein
MCTLTPATLHSTPHCTLLLWFRFCFSEVKLGVIPATISPYVIRRIGSADARRYFLTAETFGAAAAVRIGLLHKVVRAAHECREEDVFFSCVTTEICNMHKTNDA